MTNDTNFSFDTTTSIPADPDQSVLRSFPSQALRRVQLDQAQEGSDGSITVAGTGNRPGSRNSLLRLGPAHRTGIGVCVNNEVGLDGPVTDKLSQLLVHHGSKIRPLPVLRSVEPYGDHGGYLLTFGKEGASPAEVYLCRDDLDFLFPSE